MKTMSGSVPCDGISLFLAQACGKFHQVSPFLSLLSSCVTKDKLSLSSYMKTQTTWLRSVISKLGSMEPNYSPRAWGAEKRCTGDTWPTAEDLRLSTPRKLGGRIIAKTLLNRPCRPLVSSFLIIPESCHEVVRKHGM